MTPQEFMDIWGLTKEELGIVTGKGSDTLKNWFAEGARHRPPTQDVIDKLTLIHLIWSQWLEQENLLPPQVRSMFEIVKHRRKINEIQLPLTED